MQIIFILLLFPLFTLAVKWNALADDCEYYVDVTKLAKAEFGVIAEHAQNRVSPHDAVKVIAEHVQNRVSPHDGGNEGLKIIDIENTV